ncbi:hypothetical protein [Lachnoanaerobaculum saburreum]|uniref:ASCH domain protein n=1 Tax=Lachnoanaerobaculum saburreum DSM 3986 TaxID=887325 RepID=E6LM06_9FIRM|nr:hypothetical protein [Lachnoanaerobaculum saburreum]EFU77145.1 hypothetical protein HMPREF0381_0991 [Lachnoanaerobaculum saburreum DSM 3986]
MKYAIYATNLEWYKHVSDLKLSEKDSVAFWRTNTTDNFSKDIKKGDAFLMLVDMGGRKEVVGIGTFEGFYDRITVGDLWNKYGDKTGATSLTVLINQLNNCGKQKPYSDKTEISYILLSNIKCDLHLRRGCPWRLL